MDEYEEPVRIDGFFVIIDDSGREVSNYYDEYAWADADRKPGQYINFVEWYHYANGRTEKFVQYVD